jgi:hypothetical protein
MWARIICLSVNQCHNVVKSVTVVTDREFIEQICNYQLPVIVDFVITYFSFWQQGNFNVDCGKLSVESLENVCG